jgi:hypothetical protein
VIVARGRKAARSRQAVWTGGAFDAYAWTPCFRRLFRSIVKNFNVYLHPARGYEAVKEGPSFPALFMNVFWLLFHGLYGCTIVVILFGVLLVGAEFSAGKNAVNDIQAFAFRLLMTGGALVIWLLPFFHGNEWRHANLLRRGFRHINRVQALTPDDAVARCLSRGAVGEEPAGTQLA